jgi:hypothetical protein
MSLNLTDALVRAILIADGIRLLIPAHWKSAPVPRRALAKYLAARYLGLSRFRPIPLPQLPAAPKAKNGSWTGNAGASGTAGHYRLKASGDTAAATQNEKRMEGTVTATGGGGDMTIDNTNVASGQPVTVTSFSVAM